MGATMKRTKKDYQWCVSNMFNDGDSLECETKKIRKANKDHVCYHGCEIKKGEFYLYEKGIYDGNFVECKTCQKCMDKWLDNVGVKK